MLKYQAVVEPMLREAGQVIRERFVRLNHVQTKRHDLDFVTEADMMANEMIMTRIRSTFPEHGIISEEVPPEQWDTNKDYVWTIDPLDGTNPFVMGVGAFGPMVSLAYKGELVMGAVYHVCADEFVIAEKGKGAWKNGVQVHTGVRETLVNSIGHWATSFGRGAWLDADQGTFTLHHALLQRFLETPIHPQNMWVLMQSMVAVSCGRWDWVLGSGKVWDLAPGIVIWSEAGCVVTDIDGKPATPDCVSIVVANPVLHEQWMQIINQARTS